MLNLRPVLGDERGFIHRKGSFLRKIGKKVLGGVPIVGGIATGIGEAVGFFGPPSITTVIPARGGCSQPGFVRNKQGNCVPRGFPGLFYPPARPAVSPLVNGGIPPVLPVTGAEGQLTPGGDAELGRFGAGINPAFFSSQTRRCPRGMVLGAPEADGESLCYNKRDLSNKARMWPRGRRPLLTGGQMRAISIAASAAKRLQARQKQLQELGLLKKPTPRRAAPKQLLPGHQAQLTHG